MNGQSYARVKVLPLNGVITFLGFLDTPLLLPIMAIFASELGAGVGLTGLIIGIYSVTHTAANILTGRLMNRTGYKMPLIVGLLADALAMLLYSFTRLPIQLLIVRVFHGISGGLIGPPTMYISATHSGAKTKGRAMSLYGITLALTMLIGYGMSGVISSRWGTTALFQIAGIVLITGCGLSFLLPGSKKVEARHKTSSVKVKGLLKRRGLKVAYTAIFAQYFSFGGVITLLPLYVKGLGMDSFHVGMLLMIFSVMFIALQFPSGAFSDRAGRIIPTTMGLSLGIFSLILLPSGTAFLFLAIAMGIYGIAYGLIFPSISALVADSTTPEERGMATGIFHGMLTAGVALGAPIIGWLSGMMGIEFGLRLSAVFMVLALAIIIKR